VRSSELKATKTDFFPTVKSLYMLKQMFNENKQTRINLTKQIIKNEFTPNTLARLSR
jgi:hypothetical protein